MAVLAALVVWAGPAHADGKRDVIVFNTTSGALVDASLEWQTIGGGYYTIRVWGTVRDLTADGWAAVAQLKYYTPSGWEYPIIGNAPSNGTSDTFYFTKDGATYLYVRACLYKAALGTTDCSGWK